MIGVAGALASTVRGGSASVGRYAGDEFLVLLNGVKDGHACIRACERICASVRRLSGVTVSVGAVNVVKGNKTRADIVMERASLASQRAKTEGKDRFIVEWNK